MCKEILSADQSTMDRHGPPFLRNFSLLLLSPFEQGIWMVGTERRKNLGRGAILCPVNECLLLGNLRTVPLLRP